MPRQLEQKWRIILEEESNSSSDSYEGVNPWDLGPNINLTAL